MKPELHILDCGGIPVTMRLEARRHYLFAQIDGPVNTLDSSLCYWRALAQECQRRQVHRLMVRDDLEGPPMPAAELAQLVAALSTTALAGVRIAFVEPVAEHLPLMEHGQILAQESGFQAAVFAGEVAAEQWLLYGGGADSA